MPRRGENIYKRKDGRWEGRYNYTFDNNGKRHYTFSPWIYYELSMMTLIKTTEPKRDKVILEKFERRDNIKYDVSKFLQKLTPLNDDNLISSKNKWDKQPIKCKEKALDVLYEVIYPN